MAILIAAAILRLFNLFAGDPINDEVFMSFRGLGLMDFDEADVQTTPWEWFDPSIPWWAKISMHDHPLLAPLTQKISMSIFGESNFGFRLPSALLGIASVYLVYLFGRRLFSENAGLISAALLAVTLNSVYISRVGMQEAYVIFFLLLSSYLFLKSLQEDKYLLWTGVALGLGLLAKYNVFILVPFFLTYLLFFKREYFGNKKLWFGALFSVLIFSPVIVYNLMLYRAVGHFDFQFSYIFGQNPEVWQVAPGKEIGGLMDRVKNFIPRLIATNSWVFLLLIAASILGFFAALFRNFKEILRKYGYLSLIIGYLLLLLLLIGPSYRFLTMLTPFLALGIGGFLSGLNSHYLKKFALFALPAGRQGLLLYLVIVPILIFEIFYSWNNQIAYYPIGPTPWLSSKVRFENYNWGYNELNDYLEKELAGKMPAIVFDSHYKFLNNLRETAIAKGLAGGLGPYPALIIYSGNFNEAAYLWILGRRKLYHVWPIISLENYQNSLKDNGFDYYRKSGFKNYYFILQAGTAFLMDEYLVSGEVIEIKNPKGSMAFKIYKWNL